jgi:hypothetical protein
VLAKNPSLVRFGPFRLDRINRRLHHGADAIALRPKTFADRTVASVRDALGEPVFEQCWREGRLLSADDAVAYALGEARPATRGADLA